MRIVDPEKRCTFYRYKELPSPITIKAGGQPVTAVLLAYPGCKSQPHLRLSPDAIKKLARFFEPELSVWLRAAQERQARVIKKRSRKVVSGKGACMPEAKSTESLIAQAFKQMSKPTKRPLGAANRDSNQSHVKNPAAVELGRSGGLKGGIARARKLTAQRRTEIAKAAAVSRWENRSSPKGNAMTNKWRKTLTRSDAQQKTKGALMPFLRFTKGGTGKDQTRWFREEFFSDLKWEPSYSASGNNMEKANIKVRVKLGGEDLGVRNMHLDHDPARATNHRAPTTHLHFDGKTRQALEDQNFSGRSVVVERDGEGRYSLTVL